MGIISYSEYFKSCNVRAFTSTSQHIFIDALLYWEQWQSFQNFNNIHFVLIDSETKHFDFIVFLCCDVLRRELLAPSWQISRINCVFDNKEGRNFMKYFFLKKNFIII